MDAAQASNLGAVSQPHGLAQARRPYLWHPVMVVLCQVILGLIHGSCLLSDHLADPASCSLPSILAGHCPLPRPGRGTGRARCSMTS